MFNPQKSSHSVSQHRKSLNSNDYPKLLKIPKNDELCKSPTNQGYTINVFPSPFPANSKKNNSNLNISNFNKSTKNINQNNVSINNISINNISIQKSSKNINEIEQYKLHPYRRINLKLVGLDIKQKLIKMNEENDGFSDDEKILSSPIDTQNIQKTTHLLHDRFSIKSEGGTDILPISAISDAFDESKIGTKTNVIKNQVFKLTENKTDILKTKEKSASVSCHNIAKITLKNKKSELKNNDENEANLSFQKNIIKKRNKDRILKKKKLVYDSMDDNESEEAEDIIINPESAFIFYFDLLIIIFYLYSFIAITSNISRIKCFCSDNNITYNDILLFFTDILYVLDLIISFFRGSYNFEYKLTKQYSALIKNYLLGDFFFDLLEAIPIFSINKYICYNNIKYLECYKYNMPSIFYFLQIASINKILKIIKILGTKKNQVLDNFLECISENYTIERTTLLMIDSLLFIGIFHCLICFYIFIGAHTYPNWIVKTNAENESFFDIYIESFYFLVTTITTVGYGDITCSSFGERIFHILLLAIGSIFYTYIISTIGNYIKNDSNAKIKYNNDLSILENIRIAYSDMPFKLYKNIRRYLESKSSSQEKYDINSLIDGLPFTLKNNILFTMYKTVINNFKFFKKNDNSEFIAQVLTNFILVISKKNEFLVYEGEMLDEIIFVKDGRISLNAAIDIDEPMKSINTYFNEKFSPFTSDEEKKVYESRLNDCFKSGFVSTMNAEISYNAALSKINNAFKTFKNNNSEEKSVFAINNNINIENNNEEKKTIKELSKFDINGGAIKNDDGSYQYLKILDIRKNEHFGLVFMTLKKPSPLSLQVKSKFAELYNLKKEVAIAISKDYPNIWKKLYGKEFHNLTSIKTRTFKALRKYMELNQLLMELNIDEGIGRNDITVNYLNELEKSIYNDKSIFAQTSRKNLNLKRGHTYNNNLTKFKTINSESEKKQRLSAGKLFFDNIKEKLSKRNLYKAKRLSNSIIYNNFNREKILQFSNNYLNASSKKVKQAKSVHFNDENIYNKGSSKKNVSLNKQLIKKISSSEICVPEDNDSEKKMTYFKKNSKKERYSKLKQFLINLQKKLKIKYYEENNKPRNNSLKDSNNAVKIRKGILKRKQFSLMTENKNKNGELNINNNEDSNETLINEIKNFFKEGVDYSFCSINDERSFNLDDLCIINDINLEIISSYSNLNQISKGKFIKDKEVQKQLRLSMKNFYSNKSNNKVKFSSPSVNIFTNSEENVIRIQKKKTQKSQRSQKQNFQSPKKKAQISQKK